MFSIQNKTKKSPPAQFSPAQPTSPFPWSHRDPNSSSFLPSDLNFSSFMLPLNPPGSLGERNPQFRVEAKELREVNPVRAPRALGPERVCACLERSVPSILGGVPSPQKRLERIALPSFPLPCQRTVYPQSPAISEDPSSPDGPGEEAPRTP